MLCHSPRAFNCTAASQFSYDISAQSCFLPTRYLLPGFVQHRGLSSLREDLLLRLSVNENSNVCGFAICLQDDQNQLLLTRADIREVCDFLLLLQFIYSLSNKEICFLDMYCVRVMCDGQRVPRKNCEVYFRFDPFTTKISVSNINNIGHKFLIVLALRI